MAQDPRTNSNSSEEAVLDVVGGEDKLWVGWQVVGWNNIQFRLFQHIRLLTVLWVVFLVGSFLIFIGTEHIQLHLLIHYK